ncbi:BRCT domain-containing protein [Pseudomonas nicosulfuronedens]
MSALYLKVFAQPQDEAALGRIHQFISLVEAQDFDGIETMDAEEDLYDIDEVFNTEITSSMVGSVVFMEFETGCSAELDSFVAFLHRLGASDVEIAAFNSQVCEYFFMKNEEELNDYDEAEWNWLKNPRASGMAGEFVVVTGTFEGYGREEMEELVREREGTVQKSVNSRTTLLIVGSKPGKSKLDKASAVGASLITEQEFFESYE